MKYRKKLGKSMGCCVGVFMVMLMLVLACSPTVSAVQTVASGQGGNSYWLFTVVDEDGVLVVADIDAAMYDDDHDDVFDDKGIDSSSQYNVTGLKASTEYYLRLTSDDREYKSKTIKVTTTSTSSANNEQMPTYVYVEDYWSTGTPQFYVTDSAGFFALFLGLVGFLAVMMLLVGTKGGRDMLGLRKIKGK